MTHRELVEIGYKWILKNGCGCAFKEFKALVDNGEIPDVIGFGSSSFSMVIECKVSRSDFLCDKNKSFRMYPELGMGSQRFYMCPEGVIKSDELPDGWGLIYVRDNGETRVVLKNYKGNIDQRTNTLPKNLKCEHQLMYSALRRLHIRNRIEEVYDQPWNQPNEIKQ